jgi:hypothetical protein
MFRVPYCSLWLDHGSDKSLTLAGCVVSLFIRLTATSPPFLVAGKLKLRLPRSVSPRLIFGRRDGPGENGFPISS